MAEQPYAPWEKDLSVIQEDELKEPPMYKVLMHNDDYTPMEFVTSVLIKIFHKTPEIAEKLMLKIHNTGAAICGIYTLEIAETKTAQVHKEAEVNGFPLQASIEKES